MPLMTTQKSPKRPQFPRPQRIPSAPSNDASQTTQIVESLAVPSLNTAQQIAVETDTTLGARRSGLLESDDGLGGSELVVSGDRVLAVDDEGKRGHTVLLTGRQKRAILRAIREEKTVEEALELSGASNGPTRLANSRHLDEKFAAELDIAQSDVMEDKHYAAGLHGKVTAIEMWLKNRRPKRWKPDIALGLETKDVLSQRAGGASGGVFIEQFIAYPPASITHSRAEIIDVPQPRPAPADTVEGEVVPPADNANTTDVLSPASSFDENGLGESTIVTPQSDDDAPTTL